jgi:uncharacterized membrane protein
MMDILMIVLRLIHIFSGIFWVGATLFLWRFVTPATMKMGADGGKFMRALLNDTPYLQAIPGAAVATVLSGLLMYYKVSNGFSGDWMSLASSIVLTIGALAGLAAAGHGLFVIAPLGNKIKAVGNEIASAGGAPTPEQLSAMQALQAKMMRNVPIISILLIVSVFGMASARYF